MEVGGTLRRLSGGLARASLLAFVIFSPGVAAAAPGDVVVLSRPAGLLGTPIVKGGTITPQGLSDDGLVALMRTFDATLLPGGVNSGDYSQNVFARDVPAGTTSLVNRASGALGALSDREVYASAISGDGKVVAFETDAGNLGPLPMFQRRAVWVRYLATGTTILATTTQAGTLPDSYAKSPSLSQDGRYLAFQSPDSGIAGPTGGRIQIFLKDLQTGTTSMVSVTSGGQPANDHCTSPQVSADGKHVSFLSNASNLTGDSSPNAPLQVFVRDIEAGQTVMASRADGASGSPSIAGLFEMIPAPPSLSADGSRVAFIGAFDDASKNGHFHVYVRDLTSNRTFLASRADGASGVVGNDNSTQPSISADGTRVAFASNATNLSGVTCIGCSGVFLRDLSADTLTRVSAPTPGTTAASPSISGNGCFVSFEGSGSSFSEFPLPFGIYAYRREVTCPPPPPEKLIGDVSLQGTSKVGQKTTLALETFAKLGGVRWKIGDRTIDCPATASGLSFRPTTAATDVSVTVIDYGGSVSDTASTVVNSSPATVNPGSRVSDALSRSGPAFECKRPSLPDGMIAELAIGDTMKPCTWPFTDAVDVSPIRVEGCLKRVKSLNEVPAAERDMLRNLLIAKLDKTPWASTVVSALPYSPAGTIADEVNGLLANLDVYQATAVSLNGSTMISGAGATLVIAPQLGAVFTSKGELMVAGIEFALPPGFMINTNSTAWGKAIVTVGSFARSAGRSKVGGLPITGLVDVTFTRNGATLGINLKLPEVFATQAGGSATTRTTLRTDAAGNEIAPSTTVGRHRGKRSALPASASNGSYTIGPFDADFGGVGVSNVKLTYTPSEDLWVGEGRTCLPGVPTCIDMTEDVGGGVWFRGGSFERAKAVLDLGPGIAIGPGVTLKRVQADIGARPTRFFGGVTIAAAGLIEIDGRIGMVFASRMPYTLTRADIDGLSPIAPNRWYSSPLTRDTFAASGSVYLAVPLVGRQRFASGYLVLQDGGYMALGAGVDLSLLGLLDMRGAIDGEVNLNTKAFNLMGQVNGSIDLGPAGTISGTATAVLSSAGAGVCIRGVGGGVQFRGGGDYETFLYPPGGRTCPPDRFTANVRPARASAAARTFRVTVGRGEASHAIELEATAGAPRVRVTGPGGVSFSSPEAGAVTTPKVTALAAPKWNSTAVRLLSPAAGTYTVTELAGSPAVTSLRHGPQLPAAKVTGSVTGSGAQRTLSYNVTSRPGQKVTFLEEWNGATRVIGTVNGGGRGTLRFKPQPGGERRAIVAQFAIDGLPGERVTVASFAPPSSRLVAPSGVRVTRKSTGLSVSWKPVADSSGYSVVLDAAGGQQRTFSATKPPFTIPGVDATTAGSVLVRALGTGRTGSTSTARFPATRAAESLLLAFPSWPGKS